MRFSRYSPDDRRATPLDEILDAATHGAFAVPDLRDGEFDPNMLARQSAQAVRVALTELAELLTIREADGTATGWRTIPGDQLAQLAACIKEDASVIEPADLLDRHAVHTVFSRAARRLNSGYSV